MTKVQRIEISARRFTFTPGEITVKKGLPVFSVLKVWTSRTGRRIRELGVDVKIKAGETVEVKFTPDAMGILIKTAMACLQDRYGLWPSPYMC